MSYLDPTALRRGHGQISGGGMRDVVDSTAWLRTAKPRLEQMLRGGTDLMRDSWLARITGATLLSGCTRRWLYTVAPVDLLQTRAAANSLSTRFGSVSEPLTALNLYEWPLPPQTLQDSILGDGSDPAHIPAGFSVVPVRGIVTCRMWRTADTSGTSTTLVVFDRANGIDGECP